MCALDKYVWFCKCKNDEWSFPHENIFYIGIHTTTNDSEKCFRHMIRIIIFAFPGVREIAARHSMMCCEPIYCFRWADLYINSSQKSLEIVISWLSSENMLHSVNQKSYYSKVQVFFFLTTCHSLKSVTYERRYGAVNVIRSLIKFDICAKSDDHAWFCLTDFVQSENQGWWRGFSHLPFQFWLSPIYEAVSGLSYKQLSQMRYHFKA